MTSLYYLKIADIIIKIDCPKDLFLFDDWHIFITNHFSSFLVSKEKHDLLVKLESSSLTTTIPLPLIVKNTIHIDNLIHPNMFLYVLSKALYPILLSKNMLVVHASGVVIKNKAILFLGKSGSGKSTCHNKLSPPLSSLGDDEIILGVDSTGNAYVYPTPLNMKVRSSYASNCRYVIDRVIFPSKSKINSLKKIEVISAMKLILNQYKSLSKSPEVSRLCLNRAKLLSPKTYLLKHTLKGEIKELVRCS